jgi:hypothetical protein
VAVQEDLDLPDSPLLVPGLGDALLAGGADARHLSELLRRLLDHVEDINPKGLDQAGCELGADALDQAGTQVALHAFGSVGGRGSQNLRVELLAVVGVNDSWLVGWRQRVLPSRWRRCGPYAAGLPGVGYCQTTP